MVCHSATFKVFRLDQNQSNLKVCTSRPVSYMFCVPIAPDLRTSLFFPCLLTTTSDSSFVRMVGVEPTILTTIGIRLLSQLKFYSTEFRLRYCLYELVGYCHADLRANFQDTVYYRVSDWRFRKTSIPNLFVTVVDFSPARTYCCFPD